MNLPRFVLPNRQKEFFITSHNTAYPVPSRNTAGLRPNATHFGYADTLCKIIKNSFRP